MNLRTPLIGSAIVIGLSVAASIWAWPHLGDAPIATHFGADGRPNGYMPKAIALFLPPALALGLSVVFAVAPAVMPRNSRLERSEGPYGVVWLATLTLLLGLHLATLAIAMGLPVDMRRVAAVAVGALLAVTGNLLGKVRYNYMFGIRTPWTLANERVWDRTHRFAGWALTLGGLLIFAAGLIAPPEHAVALVLGGALVPTLLSVAYSYRESRRIEAAST